MNSSKRNSEDIAPLHVSLDERNECCDEQNENSDISLDSSIVNDMCVEPDESIM